MTLVDWQLLAMTCFQIVFATVEINASHFSLADGRRCAGICWPRGSCGIRSLSIAFSGCNVDDLEYAERRCKPSRRDFIM